MIRTAHRIANIEEYYFSKKLAEVRALDTEGLPVINLGIGSPDMPPSQPIIDALVRSAKAPGNHGYQSYKGTPAFRKSISEFNARVYDIKLNPESEILPLMGSKEGIMHISMAFVNEGEEVLIPNPGYPTYSSVSNLVGATIRTYTLREDKNWNIDIEELQKSDLSKVKIMWINYPHMPTGKVAIQAELQAIVDLARKNSFLIVNDNPYSLILNDSPLSIFSIEGAREVSLELNSLSKSHNMAGWRLGWVAGKQEYIDAILRVKSNMDSGMFLPMQEAACEALSNNEKWFYELNKIYKERRAIAEEIVRTLKCDFSKQQSGLFVWAKVPDTVENVEKWVDEILYNTKVFITPGFIFGSNGNHYIRISLCSPVEKMKQALQRIKKFTNNH